MRRMRRKRRKRRREEEGEYARCRVRALPNTGNVNCWACLLLPILQRSTMSFVVESKVLGRKLALVLFIISMLGPWAFDLLSVPGEFPCSAPSVRLNGDFCGYPMSGFGSVIWASGSFFYILRDLIKGNIAARIPEFITLLYTWIIVLPFFSILLLIWNKNSRWLQVINLIVLGLACLPALTIFIQQTNRDQLVHLSYLLWGVWLYILAAIATIIFEILALRANTKPGTDV